MSDPQLQACIEEAVYGLNDAQLMDSLHYPACKDAARAELERRALQDSQASGTWQSGPDSPVPYPPDSHARFRNDIQPSGRRMPANAPQTHRGASMSSKLQSRARFRKLCWEAREGPKTGRDVAKLLLQRDFAHSFS